MTVGFPDAGKSSMLITYTTDTYPTGWIPGYYDDYRQSGSLNDVPYSLDIRVVVKSIFVLSIILELTRSFSYSMSLTSKNSSNESTRTGWLN